MQLNKAYNKEGLKEFLTDFLPDDFNLSEKELVIGDNYKNIKSGLVLGESKLLGVKVFYLEHEKEKDPRVALTTEAFKILSENWAKKALVVFNSKNSENWRLSLMTISFDINEKNKIVSNLSNPKRKSFFLGPNAKIATAKQFLFNKGKVRDFEDLESRFDVEIVTKEFFNNYKKLYTKLLDYLKNDKAFNVFSARHGLELEIFGKKLLGQIVFIYFLQKKGWLGAKKGDNISNGDKAFLRSLFEKCKQDGNNFFNDCLEHLFYSCLNRLPERAGSFYREKFDCQIPFLNGGLFEPINDYKWQNEFINIPNEIFSNNGGDGILDVFDLYNFTIDENTPDDQEISVDPEMLGKVFENLLESNTRKGQGAFYTPREIVHYMCRESLVNYLATNHSNLSEENIRNYINYGDSLNKGIAELGKNWKGESFTPGQFSELNELLRNIKVVDPACGSGAFLVGMLQEIVRLRTFLQLTPDSELFSKSSNSIKELTVYDLKKETIQNCIYGVDIDPGAIDIAKLRFWLSIVVEENIEDIEPLPNLDYKIMQGNSLLEDLVIGDSIIPLKFEGKKKIDGRTKEKKDLFNDSHQAKLFIDESEALVEKLEKYHTEYFNITDPDKKKILKKKIDGVEDELIQSKCNEEIERADSFIKNNPNDSKKILKYTEKILAIKEVLRKWKTDHLRPFFPWKLHFGEVFNRDNGGFDAVIGNPPYGFRDVLTVEEKVYFRKVEKIEFSSGDSAELFCKKSFDNLVRENGVLTFIIPKKSLYGDAWAGFRRNYWLRNNLKFLLDSSKAFDNVLLEANAFGLIKNNSISNIDCLYLDKNDSIVKIGQGKKDKIFLENSTAQVYLLKIPELFWNKIQAEKINEKFVSGRLGLAIGTDFFSDSETEDKLLKGIDIGRWKIKSHRWLRNKQNLNWKQAEEFLKPKIVAQVLVAHIENPTPHIKVTACYDREGIIITNTLMSFDLDEKILPEFWLAYLNSAFVSWYAYNFIYAKAVRTMHLYDFYIQQIPIPRSILSQGAQDGFTEIVNALESLVSSADYKTNTEKQIKVKEYEKQVDRMVYNLYGLSEEEIKIVEE